MSPRVQRAIGALLGATERGGFITVDAVADALGEALVSTDEVEAVIDGVEREGRVVGAHPTARAAEGLRRVIAAARSLTVELGRTPTRSEIGARAGMDERAVAIALAFARVLRR